VWYYVGYYFGNQFVHRFGKFFDITKENIESVKRIFFKHKRKILVGSKMTAGFGLSLATLVTAGMVRAPLGEYMLLNFFGQFVWTAVMLSVGYLFGNLYLVIDNVLGRIFIIGIALIVLYLLLRFFRRLGRRAKESLS
jgi:membrane protein DedA with SNARE-associated domain